MSPAEIRVALSELVDPAFGEGQRRFFQHHVETWGVRSHHVNALVREVGRAVRDWPTARRYRLAELLIRTGKLEERILALLLLARFRRECDRCTFELIERWLDKGWIDNWATCDAAATRPGALAVANEPELIAQLDAWTTSPRPMKRRAAVVFLVKEVRAGRHIEEACRIAARLAGDPHDLVKKGVGWLLKDAYPRFPREVVAILGAHPFPALVRRIAGEKMNPADRARVRKKTP
jgi:3-methyladenine DNA glycosylase AlkD